MSITTNLSTAPYFDDYDIVNQYYRVLFKPGYAVQARELTQLQTMMQNQVEQFGDNIFKEGSIVRGCNFTTINNLKFVKLKNEDQNGNTFDPTQYISRIVTVTEGGVEVEYDYIYKIENANGLSAIIISAERGFESSPPNLNTFFITYTKSLTAVDSRSVKQFAQGDNLTISLIKVPRGAVGTASETILGTTAFVTNLSDHAGNSFGIKSSPGIVFQKGHFLYADEQTVIVSKYTNSPTDRSVGYKVSESTINAFQDNSLYDNANGSNNFNAPGADRLKLTPTLTVLDTAVADADLNFFTLIRYNDGNAVELRDISQYNVIAEAMAKQKFEESGNYIAKDFKIKFSRRDNDLKALISSGVAYVKGYRVENAAERSIVIDPIQASETDILENQNISFNYGNYLNVESYTGYPELWANVALLDDTDSTIGEAFVINATPERIYLGGSKFKAGQNYQNLAKIDPSDTGEIIVANTAPATWIGPELKDTIHAPLIFNTGLFSVKGTTNVKLPVREVNNTATINASNQIIIPQQSNVDYILDNDDILVVENTGVFREVTNVEVLNNELYITVAAGNTSVLATVFYNKNLTSSVDHAPAAKLLKEPYIKINYVSANKKGNLGFADVFEIISIIDESNNIDYTNSFRLKRNQKDHYYDHSYIEHITGRPNPGNIVLTVQLRVFKPEVGSGEHYFTAESYPKTDGAPDHNIPPYISSAGRQYNLRECYDFRPHRAPHVSADYENTSAGTAGTISDAVGTGYVTFDNTPLTPAVNVFALADVECFLKRVDSIIADSYGNFSIVKGNASLNPKPPKLGNDQLVLADIIIPGAPALTPSEAASQNKIEYGVTLQTKGTKGYTMKEISTIDKKVDSLVYYTSLNQLETETRDLDIRDENGLSRFKNGFVVDPFNDTTFADLESTEYNAAIMFNQSILTPSVRQYPINLKYESSTGSIFGPANDPFIGTLSRNENVSLISQPGASNYRNCVSNFYDYKASGFIHPEYDTAYDFTSNPEPAIIDLSGFTDSLIENLQNFVPLTDTSTINTTFDIRTFNRINRNGGTMTWEETERTTEFAVSDETIDSSVGDFITNIQFNPFIASREINIIALGLIPNTRHYFYFDGVPILEHIATGTLPTGADGSAAHLVERLGEIGDANSDIDIGGGQSIKKGISSDDNGTIIATFRIPAETFFVGERILRIADVDSFDAIETAAVSTCKLTYRAYNFSIEETSLTTRAPTFETVNTDTTRSVTIRRPERQGGGDPLAQTFFIKRGMAQGADTVMVSELDLYFKTKSSTNGLNVYLCEVVNGYPSSKILPFSKVHYDPADVNISDDASIVTTFQFQAPVRLEIEKEYAFVVLPDAGDPDYNIWISQTGLNEVTPGPTQGQPIVQDWGDGVLFTSTNNRAWQSQQNEDAKFNLKRHNFNLSTGTITMKNNDHEFFTITDRTGAFISNEYIYQEKAIDGATGANVTVTAGSKTITGTGLDSTYNAGDYILIDDGSGRKDIFEIDSVTNTTTMLATKTSDFSASPGTGTPVVLGRLSFWDNLNPFEIQLEGSSARSTRKFDTGADIKGLDSGSTAEIVSIDNHNISYVQPMIYRSNEISTSTLLSGQFTDATNPNVFYTLPMSFNENNHFNKNGVVLYSRSNDVDALKPFDITVSMANGGKSTTSPAVDVDISKLFAYEYKITNTPGDTAAYISKRVELAEEFDADDFNLFLTGYRPSGTEIKVYLKPQNIYDSEAFEDIPWIELELFEGINTFSSDNNLSDYREFKYKVSDTNKNADGILQYNSGPSGSVATHVGFRRFAIKIELLSTSIYRAPTVKDYRGIALT